MVYHFRRQHGHFLRLYMVGVSSPRNVDLPVAGASCRGLSCRKSNHNLFSKIGPKGRPFQRPIANVLSIVGEERRTAP